MKPLHAFLLILALFCALLNACSCDQKYSEDHVLTSNSPADLSELGQHINELTQQFTEAHISKDTGFLNSIFTEDARIYPPNSDVVSGKKAISQLNHDWVYYGIYEFSEQSKSFYGNEEYLVDEGIYHLKYGPDTTIDEGKYINIWKQENGDWKIYSNIWNTSLP